jgi:hypothetical protein
VAGTLGGVTWLAGPLFALALLVLGAGAAKLARPAAVVDALWEARLPWRRTVARPATVNVLAVVEIGIGAWTVAFGSGAAAVALAVLYTGFASFAWRLLAVRGPDASCGCFGATDSPVSRLHAAFTAVAALLCALAAVWPVGTVASVLRDQPAWGVPFAVLTLLAAWLAEVLLTALPARRRADATRP